MKIQDKLFAYDKNAVIVKRKNIMMHKHALAHFTVGFIKINNILYFNVHEFLEPYGQEILDAFKKCINPDWDCLGWLWMRCDAWADLKGKVLPGEEITATIPQVVEQLNLFKEEDKTDV